MNKDKDIQGFFSINAVNKADGDDDKHIDSIDALTLFPTRNLVLFPGVSIPITLGRASAIDIAETAERDHSYIGVVCQLDADVENPGIDDLYKYGVYARVIKVITMPDDSKMALVHASDKFRIEAQVKGERHLTAHVKTVSEVSPKPGNEEMNVLAQSIRADAEKLIKATDNHPEIMFNAEGDINPSNLINIMASTLPLNPKVKMDLLAERYVRRRGEGLLAELAKSLEMVRLTHEFQSRAKHSLDDKQRSVFLQQQMEEIRTELYGDDDDIEDLKKRAASANLPENVAKVFGKELEKLRRIAPQSPDYSVQYTYLQTLLDLPWGITTQLTAELPQAIQVLDEDHYGLEKVKERILEQLAVMINNPEGRSPIICLVGPPGVGKTSLGQSIAHALGRKYQRVSLGGVHDEAEIRGHRRTYIGALPGRIIDAIRRAGSSNPVILLDEVDKLGRDFKGDPSSALLEVLDPEQNCHFHDNYIDVDFDLSNVLFIATANTLSTLQQPLLDRMEVIDIAGYLPEEKVAIAQRHFLPRIHKELKSEWLNLQFPEDTLYALVERYTSESGVRQLEKRIAQVIRKQLLAKLSGKDIDTTITPDTLQSLLGAPVYIRDRYEGNDYAGVVTGLAWTAVGGEILYIESSIAAGKGEKLTLTGNLGDVMKESAVIALQYVKAHASQLGIDPTIFDRYLLHIHVPEGAIPKDGPSAGVTMVTSIVSALTQKRVRARIAMTGEITLRGRVLPVGGIKEKILAAKRAGITDIVLSADNRKNIEDIHQRYLQGLEFHYVTTIDEVLAYAITNEPVANPITF